MSKKEGMKNLADNKIHELFGEFKTVVMGRSNLIDTLLPPLVFVLVNLWLGFQTAMWAALILAVVIALFRWRRGQAMIYVGGGILSAVVAILLARFLGRNEGFFLPGLVTSGLTVGLCLLSMVVSRPMVAWTSYLARRWPLDWYWHPQVRPAYQEVTFLWAIFFGLRFLVQFNAFQNQAAGLLAIINLLTGWPATIALLIISYLYGSWRLKNLAGPSVEEFKAGQGPPWESQQRGF
jgi:hypothetical protein